MRYVHGSSLVPDISSGLNFLVQSVQDGRAKKEAEQQQQEVGNLVDLASTSTGGEQEAALLRIAQLDPRMAQIMSGVIQRNDQREAQHARNELEKGMKETLLLQQQPDHISKVRMIGSLAEQAAARGEPIDKYQNLLNMPEDKLNLELEKRRVMGTDLESLLKQPEQPKAPEVKEFKEGDQIVTRQFNPTTGQWDQLSTGDRFQSRLLTPEEEAQKARIATAGKPETKIINSDGDAKEREELAKIDAKQYGQLLDQADASESIISNLEQLESIDVNTGALEPAKVAFAATLEGFGVDASAIANVPNAEAYNAVSERLVNTVLNRAKGPQTDQDAARIRQQISSLSGTEKGNTFKINSMKAIAMRDIEMRDFIQAEMERQELDGESRSYRKATYEWNKFKRQTPLLSNSVKNPETGLPVFFHEFKQNAERKRPGISREQVIEAWRQINE